MKHIFVLIGLQFFIIYSSFGLQAELGELVKKLSLLKGSLGVLSTRLGELKTKLTIKEEKKPVASGGSCHAPKIKTPLFLEIEKGIALKSASNRELKPRKEEPTLKRRESMLESIKVFSPKNLKGVDPSVSHETDEKSLIMSMAKKAFLDSKKAEIAGGWNDLSSSKVIPAFMEEYLLEEFKKNSDLIDKFEIKNIDFDSLDNTLKKRILKFTWGNILSEQIKIVAGKVLNKKANDSWEKLGESDQKIWLKNYEDNLKKIESETERQKKDEAEKKLKEEEERKKTQALFKSFAINKEKDVEKASDDAVDPGDWE